MRLRQPPAAISRATKLSLLCIYTVPLVWMVITSLRTNADTIKRPTTLAIDPTIENYRSVTGDVVRPVANSLLIASATTLLVVATVLPGAYALSRRRGRGWRRVVAVSLGALIILNMMPQPMVVIPLFSVLAQWELAGSTVGLVLANASFLLPFSMLLMRPFFLSVPAGIEEAAKVDGASEFQVFWRIVVPLVRNGLAAIAAFVFIVAWGDFIFAVNFLNDADSYPVSVTIVNQVTSYLVDWPRMMTLAVLSSLPILVVYLVSQRYLTEGLTAGSIK